jgi:hypothetical protein
LESVCIQAKIIFRGQGVFLNNRYMDNLFINRMITPEADKTRGKGS